MFSVFYKSFKTPANIYSIDRYKDINDIDNWLIVTTKEIYILKGNDKDHVQCTQVETLQGKFRVK